MIHITYGEIRNKNFHQALWKLQSHDGFDAKQCYNVGRIFEKCQTFEKESNMVYDKVRKNVCEQYAKRNEDGTVFEPQGKGSFEVPEEHGDTVTKMFDEVLELVGDIERYHLTFEDLNGVRLTPIEMTAITPLMVPEDIQNGPLPVPAVVTGPATPIV